MPEATGADATLRQLDVCDCASFEDFIEQAETAHGRLDALVNNAGVTPLANLAAVRVASGRARSTSMCAVCCTALLRSCRS